MFEATHYLKAGHGAWDATQFPIGGKFIRPSEDTPLSVQGIPQRTQYGYLTKFTTEDGRTIWAQESCFAPMQSASEAR